MNAPYQFIVLNMGKQFNDSIWVARYDKSLNNLKPMFKYYYNEMLPSDEFKDKFIPEVRLIPRNR
jgi:hypothetical protein